VYVCCRILDIFDEICTPTALYTISGVAFSKGGLYVPMPYVIGFNSVALNAVPSDRRFIDPFNIDV
jgi:hypothetical protein